MENTAIVLITVTNIMLVTILAILVFLVYKLIKGQGSKTNEIQAEDKYHPAIRERIKEIEKLKPKRVDHSCPNHPNEPGEASCAICDKIFCKTCIKPFKSLHFCREHLELIMRYEWEEVLTLKTSTHNPEEGVQLYEQKRKIFETENIPTYIETHYKINVDQDYIETYLVLFSVKESVESVRSKFQNS